MTFEEFIDEFVTVFDETSKDELKPETKFRDLDEWSSLHGLATMNMLEQVYGHKVSVNDMKKMTTIQELFDMANQ